MAKDRATLEELFEFANGVREAGGGNPLDALLPAIPQDPNECLIALNMNFSCTVMGPPEEAYSEGKHYPEAGYDEHDSIWTMEVDDKEIAAKIEKFIGLGFVKINKDAREDEWTEIIDPVNFIVLPARIGAVAQAFDEWSDTVSHDWDENGNVKRDENGDPIFNYNSLPPHLQEFTELVKGTQEAREREIKLGIE